MKIMEIHSPGEENVLCEENNCSGKECGVKNSHIYSMYWWHTFDVNCGSFWALLSFKYVQRIICKISRNAGTLLRKWFGVMIL